MPDPTNPANPPPPPSPPSQTPALPILALVRDLMFSSRITGVAGQVGVPVRVIRDPSRLAAEGGRRLIVDLNLPGAIDAAAAWRQSRHADGPETGAAPTVVGFVSHVDTPTIQQARAAGIDQVMARSQFVQRLPDLLKGDG